jgi:hypothetical protein
MNPDFQGSKPSPMKEPHLASPYDSMRACTVMIPDDGIPILQMVRARFISIVQSL